MERQLQRDGQHVIINKEISSFITFHYIVQRTMVINHKRQKYFYIKFAVFAELFFCPKSDSIFYRFSRSKPSEIYKTRGLRSYILCNLEQNKDVLRKNKLTFHYLLQDLAI